MYQFGPGRRERGNGGKKRTVNKAEDRGQRNQQDLAELTTESHYHSLALRRQGKGESLGTLKGV